MMQWTKGNEHNFECAIKDLRRYTHGSNAMNLHGNKKARNKEDDRCRKIIRVSPLPSGFSALRKL